MFINLRVYFADSKVTKVAQSTRDILNRFGQAKAAFSETV